MFNSQPFNQAPIGYSVPPTTASQDSIAFDGFGLQNDSIISQLPDFDDLTSVELNTFKFPRDDGGGILSKYYRGREIQLICSLRANTQDEFSALLDTFKKKLRKTEGNLDILIAGETRRIRATVTSIDFGRQHYNVTFITAKVTFQVVEPFFYSASAQSFQYTGQTADFFGEFTNQGTAESDPTFYFIFGAGSATTEVSISAFGRTLTITENFAQNDILIIDSKNKSITKNGTELDYSGQFIKFPPDSCPFQVNFTGATLADLTLVVPKNFL